MQNFVQFLWKIMVPTIFFFLEFSMTNFVIHKIFHRKCYYPQYFIQLFSLHCIRLFMTILLSIKFSMKNIVIDNILHEHFCCLLNFLQKIFLSTTCFRENLLTTIVSNKNVFVFSLFYGNSVIRHIFYEKRSYLQYFLWKMFLFTKFVMENVFIHNIYPEHFL